MRPGFTYFKEIALGNDNKFTLDFSDQEFVQKIDFWLNNDYYITSLYCKLKVKNHIHNDKKRKLKNYLKKVDLYLKKEQHIKWYRLSTFKKILVCKTNGLHLLF